MTFFREVREVTVTGKFGKFLRSGKKLKFWIKFEINHFYLSQNDMQYYKTLLQYYVCIFHRTDKLIFLTFFKYIYMDKTQMPLIIMSMSQKHV